MHITELDTPVAVVDLDRLERNIERLQRYLDRHGIANRPHIKTHKIPQIAHLQRRAGATGITCQKIGEAEVMVEAGIDDVFIPYNILGNRKLERLMALTRRATISVSADSAVVVRGLARAAQAAGTTLPVLVECDTGLGRCGVQSPAEAAALARVIAGAPALHFGGLMLYPNNERTDPFVRETKALLKGDGLPVERVSGGSTHVMWEAHTHEEITEHRAGMYVYGDRKTLQSGAMALEDIAFTVITTVVSRPAPERAILDAGSKCLSSDTLGLAGHGLILEYPEARLYAMSEEHGNLDLSACTRKPAIGERVTVIPNHCCPVNNLFNEIAGVRGEQVEVIWPVLARGKVQ